MLMMPPCMDAPNLQYMKLLHACIAIIMMCTFFTFAAWQARKNGAKHWEIISTTVVAKKRCQKF